MKIGPDEATHFEPRGRHPSKESRRKAPVSLERGATVGERYVVVDSIGRGSMGAVMLAHDMQLVRRVALKVLLATGSTDDARTRMLREAKALAQLSHPNVVTIYDVGTHGGNVYLAMEYVDGEPLSAWLQTPRSWRDVLAVMAQAGQGLGAAHKVGMIHRDFKPHNVVLGNDGRVRVVDFGIAAVDGTLNPASGKAAAVQAVSAPALAPSEGSLPTGEDAGSSPSLGGTSGNTLPEVFGEKLTEEGAIVGTVGYFAPETAFERVSPRSDVFSFCATLYRALYRQPPYPSESLEDYLNALARRDPPLRPSQTNVPYWVHEAVLKGLHCDPRERFASMDELLLVLSRDPTRHRRQVVAAAAVAGLAILGGAVGWAKHAQGQRTTLAACAAGDGIIAATWNQAKRDAVGAALRKPNTPGASDGAERTVTNLDAYATNWAGTYRKAAEATLVHRAESQATMDARLECLEEQRAEFETLTDAMAQADAAFALSAVSVTYSLASPQRCLDPSVLSASQRLPSSPAARKQSLAWSTELARTEALELAGQFDVARERTERVLGEATVANDVGVESRALKLLGRNHERRQENSAALPDYYRALAASQAVGDEIASVWLASEIAFVIADPLGRPKDAEPWLALSRGMLQHVGPNDALESQLLNVEAVLLSDTHQIEACLAADQKLIDMRARVFGPDHPDTARAIANYAIDLSDAGRSEEAVGYFKHSVDLLERAWGPLHPGLVLYYTSYGRALGRAGHVDEALKVDEHALVVNAPRGDNRYLVEILGDVAALSDVRRDWATADSAARRGLELARAMGEDTKPLEGRLLTALGLSILGRGGDPADAAAKCTEASSLTDQIEFDHAEGLRCIGEAALARGDATSALASFGAAEAESRELTAGERAMLHFDHARALVASKHDLDAARALALSARDELRSVPARTGDASDVERWLASNKP
jgi:tetratricopeptide (TPR) repeat protein/predicted Ser/Thr protein kinase